jgi:hypothetical protein
MNITDLLLLTMLACALVLSYGIGLIRKDIEEIRELINKKL